MEMTMFTRSDCHSSANGRKLWPVAETRVRADSGLDFVCAREAQNLDGGRPAENAMKGEEKSHEDR